MHAQHRRIHAVIRSQFVILIVCHSPHQADKIATLESHNYRTKLKGFSSIVESEWKGNLGTDDVSVQHCRRVAAGQDPWLVSLHTADTSTSALHAILRATLFHQSLLHLVCQPLGL